MPYRPCAITRRHSSQRARQALFDRLRQRHPVIFASYTPKVYPPLAHLHLPPARSSPLRTDRTHLHLCPYRSRGPPLFSMPLPTCNRCSSLSSTTSVRDISLEKDALLSPAHHQGEDRHLRRQIAHRLLFFRSFTACLAGVSSSKRKDCFRTFGAT